MKPCPVSHLCPICIHNIWHLVPKNDANHSLVFLFVVQSNRLQWLSQIFFLPYSNTYHICYYTFCTKGMGSMCNLCTVPITIPLETFVLKSFQVNYYIKILYIPMAWIGKKCSLISYVKVHFMLSVVTLCDNN